MKKSLLIITLLLSSCLFAQVGINTTNPKAQLDIKASNQVAPQNTDGILIPRIDAFPVTNPTVDQNGMLVFLTIDSKFYYWKNVIATWIVISDATSTVKKIDDLTDGKYDGSSLFLGNGSGNTDDGSNYNVAVGKDALNINTSGQFNTALGSGALRVNTTGNGNVAIGFSALHEYNAGNNNTAIGNNAGGENTGSNNIFLGYAAGFDEVGSDKLYIHNTFSDENNSLIYGEFDTNILRTNAEFQIGNPNTVGYKFPITKGTANQVLQTDATGALTWQDSSSLGAQKIDDLSDGKSDNNGSSIFLGINAGLNNQSNHNVGIGFESLKNNTTGYQNVAIGAASLFSNTIGSFNIANGYKALFSNTSGSWNLANGTFSLKENTTGTVNVAIGHFSLKENTIGGSNVASGASALKENISGNGNVANGVFSLVKNITGNHNVALGYQSGFKSLGYANIFIGYKSGYNEVGNDKLYIESSSADANNALIYGEFNNDKLRVNGKLEFGQTGNANYLEIANLGSNKLGLNGDLIPYNNVNFDIGKNTATEHWDEVVANTFVSFSDKRTKNNISNLNLGLNEIMLLNPISYQYKKIISANNRTRFGLIAQEVEKVIPQVVINEDVDIDPKTGEIIRKKGEYKALSYTELIPVLIKATQEQQEIIKNNKTKNKLLKEKITSLEKRLLKIEELLNNKN